MGYSPSSMEYKAVVLVYCPRVYFRILTAGVDKTWRDVDLGLVSSNEAISAFYERPLVTEGFVHWCCHRTHHVLTLNVETETITETPAPLPPPSLGSQNNVYLSTGKYLSLLRHYGECSWQVWEMSRPETGEWRMKADFSLEVHKRRFNLNGVLDKYFLFPIGWLKYSELLALRAKDEGPAVFVYNLVTQEVDEIGYVIKNNVPNTPGGRLFDQEIGVDFALLTMETVNYFIWKIFEQKLPSEIKNVPVLTLYISDFQGYAYKNGDNVNVSGPALDRFYFPRNKSKFFFSSLMYHEMTHVFQWHGNFTAPGGLTEGIADYVMVKSNIYEKDKTKPSPVSHNKQLDAGFEIHRSNYRRRPRWLSPVATETSPPQPATPIASENEIKKNMNFEQRGDPPEMGEMAGEGVALAA
ncbi:Plant basic secretory protein (BSP) family protein [Striga hermonthica]|uniref:Plant basic secretory protein (BSP) family protein n=1 Tax=Striga hermonthica TaxID=68872 RepID=A0A9N7NKU0_STRHE|nr:Plant basic secretory protein (BSP) family protein [Striga hermonthica]